MKNGEFREHSISVDSTPRDSKEEPKAESLDGAIEKLSSKSPELTQTLGALTPEERAALDRALNIKGVLLSSFTNCEDPQELDRLLQEWRKAMSGKDEQAKILASRNLVKELEK